MKKIKQKKDKENLFWQKVAVKAMAKVYKDEPDYSDVPLIEPNPKYVAWKKNQ